MELKFAYLEEEEKVCVFANGEEAVKLDFSEFWKLVRYAMDFARSVYREHYMSQELERFLSLLGTERDINQFLKQSSQRKQEAAESDLFQETLSAFLGADTD